MPYGTGDFLGGLATRRSQALLVLALAETAGVIATLPAAAVPSGPVCVAGPTPGISVCLVGGLGLVIFYTGLAAGPMSVVAPARAGAAEETRRERGGGLAQLPISHQARGRRGGGMPWGTPAACTSRSHAGAATSALTWRAAVSAIGRARQRQPTTLPSGVIAQRGLPGGIRETVRARAGVRGRGRSMLTGVPSRPHSSKALLRERRGADAIQANGRG